MCSPVPLSYVSCSCFFHRFELFLPNILILILQLHVSAAGNVIVHAYRNRVLAGDQTITSVHLTKCLELCLADCRCLSFHVCLASQECQLSSHRFSEGSSFIDAEDCVFVDFKHKATTKV